MVNQVEAKLIKPLYDQLQSERFSTLATIDFETGGPNVSAISWVLAANQDAILFAVDNRSRIIQNINQNGKVVLNIIANESTYSIAGEASVIQEKLADVPLKLALVEIKINEVRDVMFYGSKISVEPQYDKTYDKVAAAKLDNQVMDAMRNAASTL
ncbi:pyridoxamine 5'-phosphate oxidase family protein [Bacillus marasmi]|uniref:pyridoxamine 5'-phosphate oxidase family protein n=1 Tax=Bacillus marasmi TaxID=1926279 RepID=UPI0011C7D13C|nr:pyridoxamine 5'-phosphate oxidase family protein [Bacillus marasmi]